MKLSFIIITNGNKTRELQLQINSILSLKIPEYEILICGKIPQINTYDNPNIVLLENEEDALRGSLGGLRNRACSRAKFENLVISDDDMLFSEDWYQNLLNAPNFEILTTCIRNPDGTRFWDNACYLSPVHGHINLNYNEDDDYKYMSGGQSWLIKKFVWEEARWDEELLIYKMSNLEDYKKGLHNEDTDFSLRCRKNNRKITHFRDVVVYHNDPSYTGVGKMVRRRSFQKDCRWWLEFNFPSQVAINFVNLLLSFGLQAEACDLLRKLALFNDDAHAKQLLINIENELGGKLENSHFSFYNENYHELVKSLENGPKN
jgi:hypothetical protein